MYVAFVIRKDLDYPVMVSLCESKQLDSLLIKSGATTDNFISNLYRGADLVNKTATYSYGKRLYELIWKPFDNLLKPGDRVYFAPSGLLHQIAFAALPFDDKTLISDRYKLSQLSTTAMLLQETRFKESLPPTMTLYGGIQYDLTEKDIEAIKSKEKITTPYVSRPLPEDLAKENTWNYLPGTLTEVNNIAAIAKQKKIKVVSLSGKDAIEESYKRLSDNNAPRVLHISTHGFFFPDPNNESEDKVGAIKDDEQVFKSSDNPLNRSGLLFTGANNTWKGQTPDGLEDGILTAYEAANVSLLNTQLVVLSACETGLGDIRGSEGVFGLQRAFKMAGTEYLMMSLWKVPDTETAEFMSTFYSSWYSGKTLTDAFIETQIFMKNKYPKDPYKWAAFVLVR